MDLKKFITLFEICGTMGIISFLAHFMIVVRNDSNLLTELIDFEKKIFLDDLSKEEIKFQFETEIVGIEVSAWIDNALTNVEGEFEKLSKIYGDLLSKIQNSDYSHIIDLEHKKLAINNDLKKYERTFQNQFKTFTNSINHFLTVAQRISIAFGRKHIYEEPLDKFSEKLENTYIPSSSKLNDSFFSKIEFLKKQEKSI